MRQIGQPELRPVWPYAMTHPLKPCRVLSTMSWTSLKMSAWVLPAPLGRPCTLSNVKCRLLPSCSDSHQASRLSST